MPSPKPAEKAKVQAKKQAGARFTATPEQRKAVEFMAGAGIREDQMVQLVTNPETGLPIDAKTLRKHFRSELDSGHTKADTMVAQGLFKNATTATKSFPGGIPVAQIFWLKTRARWKPPDPSAPVDPAATPEQQDERETARRMAFLLARGAAADPVSPKKKAKEPA